MRTATVIGMIGFLISAATANADQAYRVPREALRLQYVDTQAEVAAAHPSQRDAAKLAADRRNEAVALLRGEGRYAALWSMGAELLGPHDPEDVSVPLGSIVGELLRVQSYVSTLDAGLIRHRLRYLCDVGPRHPVCVFWPVAYWASYPVTQFPPVWQEFER